MLQRHFGDITIDSSYSNFLKNKTIAIVGPSSNTDGTKQCKKIESYDIYYEELISRNKEITIVFPTATLNLANNDIIFDIANTPSYLMGSFSEYLRKKKNSLRSLHALWSVSAIGPNAKFLLSNLTNN